MHIQKIKLINFKNFEDLSVECNPGVNCLIGKNGSGKTNFLDGIYYLSFTKSAFNAVDQMNIRHSQDFFSIISSFDLNSKSIKLQCSFQQGQKKVVKWNNQPYDKLSDHIGLLPVVLITPYDTDLIRDSSETRRKYFDMVLSQCRKDYLELLIKYNNLLRQRNALLKQIAAGQSKSYALLDTYDESMLPINQKIAAHRKAFIMEFNGFFDPYYNQLSQGSEQTAIVYQSRVLQSDFEQKFKRSREDDIMKQRTIYGVHRDDYLFEFEARPIKKFGSQGQQKSFVIALKLAQFDIIKQVKAFKPILLMDDIFDKLDDDRIAILTELVCTEEFGQLFITDARPERTRTIFGNRSDVSFFKVNQGLIEAD